MTFYVIEFQTNDDSGSATSFAYHDDIAEARAKFHTLGAVAAKSSVKKHMIIFIDENGAFMEAPIAYSHEVVAE